MNYAVNYVQSPNHSTGRKDIIRGIVLHTIVGSAGSAVGWFKNPASQVSAHYVVGLDGSVTQCVRDEDAAWHAGRTYENSTQFAYPNESTIGIEHDDNGDPANSPRSDALYLASGSLVRDLCSKYGIPIDRQHIVGHREIYGKKSCPGNLDIDRIIEIAKATAKGGEEVKALANTLRRIWFFMNGKVEPDMDSINAEATKIINGELDPYDLVGDWYKRYVSDAIIVPAKAEILRLKQTIKEAEGAIDGLQERAQETELLKAKLEECKQDTLKSLSISDLFQALFNRILGRDK